MACISILEISLCVLLTYACSHHCYICRSTLQWHETIDANCPKMKRCIEIARICVDHDPRKRPTLYDIICALDDIEITVEEDPPIINEPRNDPRSSLHKV